MAGQEDRIDFDHNDPLRTVAPEMRNRIWEEVFRDMYICITFYDNERLVTVQRCWPSDGAPMDMLMICKAINEQYGGMYRRYLDTLHINRAEESHSPPLKARLFDGPSTIRGLRSSIRTLITETRFVDGFHQNRAEWSSLRNVEIESRWLLTLADNSSYTRHAPKKKAEPLAMIACMESATRVQAWKGIQGLESLVFHIVYRWNREEEGTASYQETPATQRYEFFRDRHLTMCCPTNAHLPGRHYVEQILSYDYKNMELVGLRTVPYDEAEESRACECNDIEAEHDAFVDTHIMKYESVSNFTTSPWVDVVFKNYVSAKSRYENFIADTYGEIVQGDRREYAITIAQEEAAKEAAEKLRATGEARDRFEAAYKRSEDEKKQQARKVAVLEQNNGDLHAANVDRGADQQNLGRRRWLLKCLGCS